MNRRTQFAKPCALPYSTVPSTYAAEVIPARLYKFFEGGYVGSVFGTDNYTIGVNNPAAPPSLGKPRILQLIRERVIHWRILPPIKPFVILKLGSGRRLETLLATCVKRVRAASTPAHTNQGRHREAVGDRRRGSKDGRNWSKSLSLASAHSLERTLTEQSVRGDVAVFDFGEELRFDPPRLRLPHFRSQAGFPRD